MVQKVCKVFFGVLAGILFVVSSLVLIGRFFDWVLWNFFAVDVASHYLSSLMRNAFVPSVICFVVIIFIASVYFFQSTFGRSYR